MSGPASASIRHSRLAAFLKGCRAAIVLPAWVVGFAQLGIGALAYDIGIPFGMAVLSSPLIWAGPAQFVLFGSLAAGIGLVSIALAVSLTSMRLLPMALTLLALMQGRRRGIGMRIFLAHYVVVTTWVESMRALPDLPAWERVPWYLGFANTCILVTTALTGLGYMLSSTLPLFIVAGFLFLTPLFFALSLIAGARDRADIAAISLGAVLVVVLGPVVGPDFDLLAAGLIGGMAAYSLRRMAR